MRNVVSFVPLLVFTAAISQPALAQDVFLSDLPIIGDSYAIERVDTDDRINVDKYAGSWFDNHLQLQMVPGERPPKLLVQLGIKLRQINDWILFEHLQIDEESGLIVDNMLARLPADKAGLAVNDIVIAVNNRPVFEVADFIEAYEQSERDEVRIQIMQNGVRKEIVILKTEVANWPKRRRIGVHVDTIPKALADHLGRDVDSGLFVNDVVEGTPAEIAGIRAGDILVKADEVELDSVSTLNAAVQKSAGKQLSLELLRNGRSQFIEVVAEVDPSDEEAAATNLAGMHLATLSTNAELERANHHRIEKLVETVEELRLEIIRLRESISPK